MRSFPSLFYALICALCVAAKTHALTDSWSVNLRDHSAVQRTYKQGETIDMRITLRDGLAPADLTGATAAFYWYTNATANIWWTNSAAISGSTVTAAWTPSMDTGAASYPWWIGIWPAGSTSPLWRVNGTIRMLASPGFTPNALVPPVRTLDFAAIALTNAPWVTSADWASASNALAAALQDAVAPLADTQSVAKVAARVEEVASAASTGTVSSVSSDTALRLVSEEAGWWVSVEAGTATLWRVQIDGSNLLYQIGENFQDHLGSRPPAASYPHPFTSGAWRSAAGGGGYGIINTASGAMWYGGPGAYPLLLEPQDERAEGTATYGWIAQTSTNAVGTYVTAADLAAALAEYNPAAVTQALDVAQAAFASATNAQAQAEAVDQRLTSATNHIVVTYFASSNAWIEVDYSNKTAAVVMVGESGTNSVLLSEAGASLDPDATNTIWIAINQNHAALSAALALKADAAWGQYAPDGTPNPEPDYMLWLNRPATMFASGYTWATYGTYAALTADGTVAFESGGEGSLRIGPDPTNHFGYAVGGSVIVGARTDSLTVYDGGTSNGYAEIIYDYEGGGFPVAWFTPSLSVAFTEIPDAQWADNLDGTATLTVPATAATGFWRATTTAEIDSVFVSTMPARFDGGVLGGTNALPVIFDSVIQIESGGKTYRIPAQEVE